MEKKIFVYGTLMEGFRNYIKYLDGKVITIEKAKTKGKLYHIKNKDYPGLCSGKDDIYGELITFNTDGKILKEIDMLERYNGIQEIFNEYNRCPIEISIGDNNHLVIDSYIYNSECPDNKNDELVYIPYGDWRKYVNKMAYVS